MLVRCLENTSPAETLVVKGVLEDLVRFGVCFLFHILSVHRDAETQSFYVILGSPIVVNLKVIPVITQLFNNAIH